MRSLGLGNSGWTFQFCVIRLFFSFPVLSFIFFFLPAPFILFYFIFFYPVLEEGVWSSSSYHFLFSFFSRIQIAARGRGRGRGAGGIGAVENEGMEGLDQENGNTVLNQAVQGMNAAMQAVQDMMQQQQQMF